MELGGPTSAEIIERATRSTLAKAEELGARSLALVAFGTGVGGFPLDEAARIMVGAAREHTGELERIVFAVHGDGRGARLPRGALSLPVLVAPDSFKGTFSAREVAAAIAAGLRSADREARELPVADGGEGTMEVLVTALGGEVRTVTVVRSARPPDRGRLRAAARRLGGGGDGAGERPRAGRRGRARRLGGLHPRHRRADRGRRGGRRREGDRDGGRVGHHRRRSGRARGPRRGGREGAHGRPLRRPHPVRGRAARLRAPEGRRCRDGEAPRAPAGRAGRATPARPPRRADDRSRRRPFGRALGGVRRAARAGRSLRARRDRLRRS